MVIDADKLKAEVKEKRQKRIDDLEKRIDKSLKEHAESGEWPYEILYTEFPDDESVNELAAKYEEAKYVVSRGSTYLHISLPQD
jgi:hypothetical protein